MNKERAAANPIVLRAARALSRSRLVVLAYHGVDDPELLRAQLSWLQTHRRAVGVNDLSHALARGSPLEAPSFMVTFDDGRRSVLDEGVPVLEALGVPAVVFVVAGLVGSSDPFWWDEVQELSDAGGVTSVVDASGPRLTAELKAIPDVRRRQALAELRSSARSPAKPYPHLTPEQLLELEQRGVSVGSHSMSHPCLDMCPTEQVQSELTESRERLEEWLAHPVAALAYPNGNVDDRVARAAHDSGYSLGFVFDHRLTRHPPVDPLRISRLRVDSTDSLDRFKGIASGVSPLVLGLRGRR